METTKSKPTRDLVNFNNTGVAFAIKNDRALRRAYFLFLLIARPWLVRAGKNLLHVATSIRLPVNWIVRPTIFRQFCGGESLEECEQLVSALSRLGVQSILDYSVEGKENRKEIEAAHAETLRTIVNAAQNPNIPFAVFKPTAFTSRIVLEKMSEGMDVDESTIKEADQFRSRVDVLCKTAHQYNIPVMIDAEDQAFQAFIDLVVEEMMLKYNREKAIVFNTLQMYRHDRLDFLDQSIEKAYRDGYYLGIKFVRGAYMERERERAKLHGYESPIYPSKTHTDEAFDKALEIAVRAIDRTTIFCGTHNEKSCQHLARLMQAQGLRPGDKRIWFSQLHGMSDHISFNLAKHGYNVAKYIPYGPIRHVLPYLIRRTEENTSVAGQTSRELSLLREEIKRRKANN